MTSNLSISPISRNIPIVFVCSALTVVGYLQPFMASAQSAAPPEAIADEQRIKRMEENLLLTQSVAEAKKLTAAGEYAKAQARYEDILAKTPNVSNGVAIRKEAQMGLAQIYATQAKQSAAQNEYSKARVKIEQALAIDPKNSTFQAMHAQIKSKSLTVAERFPGNTAASEDLQERVNNIRQLFYEGNSYINTGQYSRAESKFNEVLKIDRYNKAALNKLKEINQLKNYAASIRRDAFKEKAMNDVVSNWDEIRLKRNKDQQGTIQTTEFESSNVDAIYDKLESIKIPELNFTEVDVADAIQYLQDQSKALDPKGEGVNFVLKTKSTGTPAEGTENTNLANKTLTLDLRDLPLIKVLEFIEQLTDLKFKVEEYAVYIFPANETSDIKVVRSFPVPPTFFSGVSLDDPNQLGADVKSELASKGVTFASDTSATYLRKTAKLVVRNTLEQISLIEQLIEKESGETIQISIETKFIEFSEDSLKDFSANLRIQGDSNIPAALGTAFLPPIGDAFNNVTGAAGADGIPDVNGLAEDIGNGAKAGFGSNLRGSGSLLTNQIDSLLSLGINRNPAQLGFSGVLGNSGFRFLLSALESNFGSDLMSAPKVTLMNGQKSKIRVVREFFYPEEYEAPDVDIENRSNAVIGGGISRVTVTPSNPTDFTSVDLGITLDVKANATPDRRIDLELLPEVIEFEGFINYGENITISDTAVPGTVNVIGSAENLRPVFSVRKVETKIQVIDGQTVVMAGFIRNDEQEINDKVPFLGDLPLIGRAFRSKTSQSVKSNLMIFVTARMINSDGTPKFLTEQEAEEFGLTTQNNLQNIQ